MPSAQRASALRFAWARIQQARGLAVWNTPEVLTWQAWLSLQWRSAMLLGSCPALQLLNLSQERLLWEQALQQLGAGSDDPDALPPHAAALMRTAARATQSLLSLSRSAVTDEERLLATARRRVREHCAARGLLAVNLALPEEMGFLAGCVAPLIVGELRLTALQSRCQQLYWPDAVLMPASRPDTATVPELRKTDHLDAEIAACARWCRSQLLEDGSRRLLVISAWQDPGAHTQGALLWREFAGNGKVAGEQRQVLLAVEGGESLLHQSLVADALAALAMLGEWLDAGQLLQLLRSPYFGFGNAADCGALQARLGSWGLARWRFEALQDALATQAGNLNAAASLRSWLAESRAILAQAPNRNAIGWAECFSQCLRAAGFAAPGTLDSRDAQRLARWGELLDEFAGLDAALQPLDSVAALQVLKNLAQQSIHQSATGDAAITFSTRLDDPVIAYDGIWVMGLAENRWPQPPRPDPYVPLHEQRRCDWPEAGVTQRLQEAHWLQERWRLRTACLVMSYAEHEGDVRHRPSALLSRSGLSWTEVAGVNSPIASAARIDRDMALPPLSGPGLAQPLRGGVERLRVQQDCAFRAQAQWRLGAMPPETRTDGIPSRLRGMLLHSQLDGLWQELQDQQRLLQLTPESQAALIERHWQAALRANARAGTAWIEPGVLERERVRAARLLDRVLLLDRERAPFVVRLREHETVWRHGAASLRMRIDRIDETAGGNLLIDYKSGEAGTIKLQEGEARPLQLAAYVVALADSGIEVGAALLLSLKPAQAQFGYVGASGMEKPLSRRVRPVADWHAARQQWLLELQQLLAQHLSGGAQLAASTQACRYCHLSAFCRRRALGDELPEEEGSDE